jgi:Arc/MetJ family transcription regulator
MCGLLCKGQIMATNLAIDDRLLNEALKVGHFKSKKETVNTALLEFVQKRRQKDILSLFGSIDFDKNYDYKKARRR